MFSVQHSSTLQFLLAKMTSQGTKPTEILPVCGLLYTLVSSPDYSMFYNVEWYVELRLQTVSWGYIVE